MVSLKITATCPVCGKQGELILRKRHYIYVLHRVEKKPPVLHYWGKPEAHLPPDLAYRIMKRAEEESGRQR
jgi:hypothetical protein